MKGWVKAIKWAYFENLSTTTRMQLQPLDGSKPSTKSKLTTCQACEGTGRGWRSPGYLTLSDLACWQTKHWDTKAFTTDLRPGQANISLIFMYVTRNPEWPPIAEECKAEIICCCNYGLLATHILDLYLIIPLSREKWPWGEEITKEVNNLEVAGCVSYVSVNYWTQTGWEEDRA